MTNPYQTPTILDTVMKAAVNLHAAAVLDEQAAYHERAGYLKAAERERIERDEALDRLGPGGPDVARLRAAVILLSGIDEDDTLADIVRTDLDRLTETLRRIDSGEL